MTNTAADAPMGTDKTASGKSGPTTTKKKKKGGGRLPPALVTRREELVLGLFKGDGQSPLGYALGPDLSVAHANDHLSHVRFDLDPATFDPNYQGLRMNNKRLYELRGIAQQKIKGGYTGPTKENGPVTMTQANRSTVEATGEPIVLKLIGGETPKDFLGRLFSKLASSGLANLRLGSCEGDYAVITPQ